MSIPAKASEFMPLACRKAVTSSMTSDRAALEDTLTISTDLLSQRSPIVAADRPRGNGGKQLDKDVRSGRIIDLGLTLLASVITLTFESQEA